MITTVLIAGNCSSHRTFVPTSSCAVVPTVSGNADEITTAGRSKPIPY